MMRAMISSMLALLLLGVCFISMSCSSDPPVISIEPPLAFAYAEAAWSPDGKTIAVAWRGIPTFRRQGLFLIDTSDWTVDTLLIAGEYETPFFSSPSWSPLGEWLVFAANAQIYKVKANGDSLTQLTNKDRHWLCDWSDSDTLVVYNISIGDSGGIWLMNPQGGASAS
jgi:Tol biopolymer transport system component